MDILNEALKNGLKLKRFGSNLIIDTVAATWETKHSWWKVEYINEAGRLFVSQNNRLVQELDKEKILRLACWDAQTDECVLFLADAEAVAAWLDARNGRCKAIVESGVLSKPTVSSRKDWTPKTLEKFRRGVPIVLRNEREFDLIVADVKKWCALGYGQQVTLANHAGVNRQVVTHLIRTPNPRVDLAVAGALRRGLKAIGYGA